MLARQMNIQTDKIKPGILSSDLTNPGYFGFLYPDYLAGPNALNLR
jgi:hypothetical protein